ncbi:SDR family NAD(P)-dependent oxidoreductase [Kitasatospora aureofaciens]|uniref:SDR family NAD(P)-dependent oxidoreductase n=1 Tax=Kitasatospora aureofaciens TaxID=1894 RepID=UPI001C44432E|nr:SDR family NAD(P)-dependent oxidoreductase [Kitasatospora aureofaciens]MBV6699865.1 SDR family NAD(P)-dependent oxidoreductase [Kitasatospora aureofaciens]
MTARTVTLPAAEVAHFAAASADVNPLHTDEDFARRTPYGRPIAHGALVVLTALAVVPADRLARLTVLTADFLGPVYPDVPYQVVAEQGPEQGRLRLRISCRGETAAVVGLTLDGDRPLPQRLSADSVRTGVPEDAAPRVWSLPELAGADRWTAAYHPDPQRLRELADRLGGQGIPDPLLLWLAGSSWVVGMQAPGRDALFAGLRLTRQDGPPTPDRESAMEITRADPRTGAVGLRATGSGPEGSAVLELRTFVRLPVPVPTRVSVAAHLTPSQNLADRQILLTGGSRGFGAALAGAFASQGATVWTLYARSQDRVQALRQEFGANRIRPLRCDATNPAEVARVIAQLESNGIELDGVAVVAAPPLQNTTLHPDSVAPALEFIQRSLGMALHPLTAALPLLRRDGWLLAASSDAVADPPDGWGHYAAAKAALESYAAYCGRRHGVRTLLLRPPKMHTDLVNSPTARLGAVSVEQVAAAALHWVIGNAGPQGATTVLDTAEILRTTDPSRGQP